MKYFIIAGEASGDLHGSRLMQRLKIEDPQAEFCFLGGDKMASVAGSPIVHCKEMAIMGFVNVIKNLPIILAIEDKAQKACIDFQPDKIILIDYPSFNIRFAKFARKKLATTEVIYYISPKLWAWKSWRIRSIKRYVHRMFTIFPFETEYYAKRHYKVTYVGNPSVDSVTDFAKHCTPERNKILKLLNDERPIIALLPGSRRQEIKDCLPKMCAIAKKFSNYQFVIAAAPSIEIGFYENLIKDSFEDKPKEKPEDKPTKKDVFDNNNSTKTDTTSRLSTNDNKREHNKPTEKKQIKVIYNNTYKILQKSSAAIVNSGTATLETALFNTPQMVVYHVPGGNITMLLKKIFIKTKYISLVNILAGKEVVRELIGPLFTTDNITAELHKLLEDKEYITTMQSEYQTITDQLGAPGAAERLAKEIVG